MTSSDGLIDIVDIGCEDIESKAKALAEDGSRLVQICATSKDGLTELLYSFDKDFVLTNYRLQVPDDMKIPSITGHFWSAFIFENEIHDLFDVQFTDLVLDYKGNFFRLSSKAPWKSEKNQEVD